MTDYSRSKDLFNPEHNTYKTAVYGIGSVGSRIALALADIGFKDIEAIDYDTVDEANLAPQMFLKEQQDMKKAEAIKDLILRKTGTEIKTVTEKIEESTTIMPDVNKIYILAFDSLPARKMLYEKLKGYPVWLVDLRIGGMNHQAYCLRLDNEDHCKEYEETMKGEASDLKCGEKAIAHNNMLIAAIAVNHCRLISQSKTPPNILIGNMDTYRPAILGMWQKEAEE